MAYKPVAGPQMAAPNVIPMADIMLVLLIIFMVVTPMLQKTHQVDLAPTNNPHEMKDADKDDAIVVAITSDGKIFLGNTGVNKEDLTGQIKDRIERAGVRSEQAAIGIEIKTCHLEIGVNLRWALRPARKRRGFRRCLGPKSNCGATAFARASRPRSFAPSGAIFASS